VAGSSNVDFVVRVAEMPRKGETILTKTFDKIPGGKGANQACACGKLGGNCVFLSVVGRDGLGDIVVESLREANVDVGQVLYQEAAPTGMAIIAVNDDGENSIMLVPGANALCDTAYFEAKKACVGAAHIVLTQLETPPEDIYRLLETAKKAGKTTLLDPAPAPGSIPDTVLSGLDFLTPNETELEKITGKKAGEIGEIGEAAQTLLKKGVRNVIVTIGPRGALLCNEEGIERFPAFEAERVDTTAAGDTFSAGLAVALAEGKTTREAIEFASAAAAISITRKGAQTSIPSREEVTRMIYSR
jgi:ribokinase